MPQKYIIELEAKADKAIEGIDELKKEIKRLNEAVVSSNKNTTDGIKNVEKATKGAAKQIKNLGAFIGKLGLGLLIASFDKVKEIFKSSQPVVDTINTSFEFLGLLFKDFVDFITNNWESGTKPIRDFFAKEGVQKGVKAVSNFMLELITRLKNVIQGLGGFASAFGKLITGNFSGAMASAKEAVENFTDAVIGNEQETQAVKETILGVTSAISNYTKKTIDAAKANIQLNKSAAEARILRQGLIEQYDREAEKLRQVRDEERNTIAERIEANNKLSEVLDKQEEQMLKTVDAEIAAAQAAFDRSGLEEDRLALIEAQQEKTAVLAQIEGFRSEQLSNDLALSREVLELTQSQIDADSQRAIDRAKFDAEQIEGEYLKLQALQTAADLEREIEIQRLTDKRDLYKQGTQAWVDANNELEDFQARADQADIDRERKLQLAKEQLVSNAIGNLINIVGAQSKFGKGLAIVQAIRDTYLGANKALASAPPPFNFIQAAAVIAGGIANVKEITSTQDPQPPSIGGARGVGSVAVSAPAIPSPPAFNVVGASAGNQLAEVISGAQSKPMKAYVVSREVTSAQELDRNAVRDASI